VDPRIPTPGTGAYDWNGYHEFYSFNPKCINPEQGYLINWNNSPQKYFPRGDFTFDFWNTYQRIYKIVELIEAKDKLTAVDMKAIEKHIGFKVKLAEVFKPIFMQNTTNPSTDKLETARQYLNGWDDFLTDNNNDGYYDSVGLTIWHAWFIQTVYDSLKDEFGDSVLITLPYIEFYTPPFATNLLLHQLLGAESPIQLSRDYFNGVTSRNILLGSLTTVLNDLETQFGSSDMSTWLTPVVPHSFANINFNGIPSNQKPVRDLHQLMNRGTQVHLVHLEPGHVYGENIHAPGQSAFIHPNGTASPHYNDQLSLFEDYNGFKQMLLEKADVKKNKESMFFLIFDD
ncbi:MAG: hypothetical protein GY757_07750, partial [bacterium]|nr:hypothetical protein [bacterium]